MRCHGWDNMAPGKNRWHHDPGTALAGPLPDPLRRFDRGAERAANPEHQTDRQSDPMHRRAGTLSGDASERVETVAIQVPLHAQAEATGNWPLSRCRLGRGPDTHGRRPKEGGNWNRPTCRTPAEETNTPNHN